jgi:hypothetical protein
MQTVGGAFDLDMVPEPFSSPWRRDAETKPADPWRSRRLGGSALIHANEERSLEYLEMPAPGAVQRFRALPAPPVEI